ncbi:uncharacterized protein IL334_006688 [Kwoniella shivajii]|uniref:DUS-like FMN-binding domain-containing protein n=1 Tax=Kwoniella shivajii TaxID=564305 RepID=A0ABZ1D6M3_9TREE|nr:hypothetical protein IL334_006688 [Kwoniella shivajii]
MPVATARSLSPSEDILVFKRFKSDHNVGHTSKLTEQAELNVEEESINASVERSSDEALDVRSEIELVEEQMSLPVEYPRVYEKEIDYREKLVLAPMVRTGSLPMVGVVPRQQITINY